LKPANKKIRGKKPPCRPVIQKRKVQWFDRKRGGMKKKKMKAMVGSKKPRRPCESHAEMGKKKKGEQQKNVRPQGKLLNKEGGPKKKGLRGRAPGKKGGVPRGHRRKTMKRIIFYGMRENKREKRNQPGHAEKKKNGF